MADLITVQSKLPDNRVALWERDPRHPAGEAYVAGGMPVQVAKTPMVERKLASGELVEMAAPTVPAPDKPHRKTKAEIAAEIAEARGEKPAPPPRPKPNVTTE